MYLGMDYYTARGGDLEVVTRQALPAVVPCAMELLADDRYLLWVN